MKPNILYIEDHPDNRMLVRRIFQPDGYNLIEAGTGILGLDIAEHQDVDLVLLDINLPDIDGYEVVHRLRTSAKECLAHIPVIAVTANAMRGDAQKILNAGCDAYMSKPINIIELLDMVNALMQKDG